MIQPQETEMSETETAETMARPTVRQLSETDVRWSFVRSSVLYGDSDIFKPSTLEALEDLVVAVDAFELKTGMSLADLLATYNQKGGPQ